MSLLARFLSPPQLSGAALDVFNEEQLPEDHPVWGYPKIVVTPHIAAFSVSETAVDSGVSNIERIEKGEPPLYFVDFDRGY